MTANEKAEPKRVYTGQWILLGAALSAFAAAVFFWLAQDEVVNRAETAETAAAQESVQKDEVIAAVEQTVDCTKPQEDRSVAGLCSKVQEAKRQPTLQLPAEQVDYSRVRSYVNEALSQDPRLTEGALLALVRQVFQQNPPKDGESPTPEELLTYIRQVYAENPPEDGVDGTNGTDGINGLDGKNAFCFDNPSDPACQPKIGPQGISVVAFGKERTPEGQCVLAQILENPATGERQTIRIPVPDVICQEDPPPQESPTPEEPLLPGN